LQAYTCTMVSTVWKVSLMVLISAGALAQESVTQQTNPPSLKWYQINTANFRILYPKGFEDQAQRMASTMELIREPEAASMGVQPKKISIILQNQSSVSNAFVTLAPRHSEFYAMPSQNYNFVGNNDWLNLLASHEYRHIVQFQRCITGFNKFFYTIFGQQALAGLAFAAAPEWFWEGDAVATETAFTQSGRGRIPNFNLVFKTNLLEGRIFNYHKQYLRSYKNNIPNHYVLGYNMISYLRIKKNDPDIWEKVVGRSWGASFIPFTFSNALKKETGMYVTDLYKKMAGDLTQKWRDDLKGLNFTPFTTEVNRKNTAYTDYLYPLVLEDGRIVVQKSGIGDIEQLIVLDHGEEVGKYVQGQMNATGMMSAAGSKVVWNEFRYDPRWQVRTYSVIKGYDFRTHTATVLSSKSRYASAAISPDGQRVATVKTGTDYKTTLVILDYVSGRVLQEVPNPDNDFISMPHWDADGETLVALRLNKTGKAITRYNVTTETSQDLFFAGTENIGYPVPFGKYILYNSPYSGIDNIYALDTQTGKRYQVTCSKYAAYNPAVSPDGRSLYYNEQTRNGLDVVKTPFDSTRWKPIEEVQRKGSEEYDQLVAQEKHPDLLSQVTLKKYVARRYHRASGMINVHSWGPYFASSYTQAQVGFYSQDILSTTSINAGYLYDVNEKTGSLQAGISYQGFFPIIDFQVYTGNRNQTTSLNDNSVKFNWKETGASIGLRVPLILTRSKYFTQLEFDNFVGATQVSSFGNVATVDNVIVSKGNDRSVPLNDTLNYIFTTQLSNGLLRSNSFTVSYSNTLKQSTRDYNPKFGQLLAYENYSTPYGGDFKGSLWVLRGTAFLPGLLKHHSFYLRGGYQSSFTSYDPNTYTFRNRVYKPRGYSYPNDQKFYSISGNYTFPAWYPDIALGPVLNIQRIIVNGFYDYGNGQGTSYFYHNSKPEIYYGTERANYLSQGCEVLFDFNFMRLLQQLELGFRVTHRQANQFNNSGVVVEFLVGNIPF
jgi:WD40-like Beta Propeller Repeat